MTDLLAHVESVWQAVVADLPTFTVEVVPSIDSTSSELMRRARDGLTDPVLLVAEEQTAGRGRMGKGWHSKPGQSLTFSLALPLAPADWSGLSLAVGVSLAESLHPDVRLKWPNDLWLQERKLGGILVETAGSGEGASAPRTVVIGVGINIARPEAGVVAASAVAGAMAPMPPAGLSEVRLGVTAGETLALVAPALVRDVLSFGARGFAPFAPRFAERDALRGRTVHLSDGTDGRAEGVDPQGALRVLTPSGLRLVHSAEVSVRPC
ncbi:biotin--[acetyl-CoA-carboxylase] ligase [Hydrogenophaga sp.]|uniref:biotin--[acetyl-CoA-carboxylase] ligase n=1 Tax=Hydrogenophaga sp. TaxID=1904254 RepID=UPI0035B251D7